MTANLCEKFRRLEHDLSLAIKLFTRQGALSGSGKESAKVNMPGKSFRQWRESLWVESAIRQCGGDIRGVFVAPPGPPGPPVSAACVSGLRRQHSSHHHVSAATSLTDIQRCLPIMAVHAPASNLHTVPFIDELCPYSTRKK